MEYQLSNFHSLVARSTRGRELYIMPCKYSDFCEDGTHGCGIPKKDAILNQNMFCV